MPSTQTSHKIAKGHGSSITFNPPKDPSTRTRAAALDWNDPTHIKALNAWHAQNFRRILGPSRAQAPSFADAEDTWIYERHAARAAEHAAVGGDLTNISWDLPRLAVESNPRFEGRGDVGGALGVGSVASLDARRRRLGRVCREFGIPESRREGGGGGGEEDRGEDESE